MHKLCLQRCTVLLLALLLALLMAGCGGEKGEEPSTAAITAAGGHTQQSSSYALETSAIAGGETHAVPSTSPQAVETGSSTTQAGISSAAPSHRQEETEPAPAQQTVSLAVTCRNAVEKGVHKWPGYGAVVPESGVIFSGSVALQEGDTVLEVLKRTLKEQNIALSEKRGYVRSINGLSEKLRGEESFPQSGWLYQVNGVFQSIGSNQYRLKAGDQIEWVYTCEPGDSGLSQ
ncbi:MAG TPA: DUF4430 domain-containing protein [Candidatus Fimivicinus intestinavium]|nr:DUF4430 domain-containing protein [Candidatus Fimivicinus intestinavium]